jgi:hypothetical protein
MATYTVAVAIGVFSLDYILALMWLAVSIMLYFDNKKKNSKSE